jgi:hypothetical protein
MPQFTSTSGLIDNPELIPHGTIALAIVTVGGDEISKNGAPMNKLSLQITGTQFVPSDKKTYETTNEYDGKQISTHMMNTDDVNKQKNTIWYDMCCAKMCRIMEYLGVFTPGKDDTYKAIDHNVMLDLIDQKTVAIRITIQKSKEAGRGDQNDIEFITPHPDSRMFNYYNILCGNATSGPVIPTAQTATAAKGPPAFLGGTPATGRSARAGRASSNNPFNF